MSNPLLCQAMEGGKNVCVAAQLPSGRHALETLRLPVRRLRPTCLPACIRFSKVFAAGSSLAVFSAGIQTMTSVLQFSS